MSPRILASLVLFIAAAANASCGALGEVLEARAALLRTYRISGQIQSNTLGVQTFEGSFQLDQFGVAGVGVETLPPEAMTSFQLSLFGSPYGPVAGAGSAEFVDGRLNRVLVVVQVPSSYEGNQTRAVGFSTGFGPEGVPDDGTGRWVGCLTPQSVIDGWGKYVLEEVPSANGTGG